MSMAFKDVIPKNNNLVLIDSLNMAFRWKRQGLGWYLELNKTIESLSNSYNARDTIVLGDGGSIYRKSIYPDYKGNRNKDDQTDAEKQEWKDFFEEYTKAMENVKYPRMRCKGLEADDIIAYLCMKLKDIYEHIWIISSDRDLDLLLNDSVSRFSLFSKKEFTMETFEELYGYTQDKHLEVKVLNGDTGDNIIGIPGVGPKRAVAILDKFGPTAYDVMDNLPIAGTAKYIQELNKFDSFELNYELMDLETYSEQAIREAGYLKQTNLMVKHFKGELDNLPQIYESREQRKERELMEDDI